MKILDNILDFIHKDEYLVVTRIDHLARSLKDLQIISRSTQNKRPSSLCYRTTG